MGNKPLASLSLDLDNKWSYLKTHGDAAWKSLPTYLPLVVPRVLRHLAQRDLTITFFVVGQDAERGENQDALRSIADAGHEIGNHSYHHEPWLHRYAEGEVDEEIGRAEAAIAATTGYHPQGFRGPGFSLSPTTLRVLARRGYQYDASTFPTFLGPLARTYYFLTARLTKEQKEERAVLFGTWREGLRSLQPYRWPAATGSLLEIPVTTFPWLRTPIHVSYVLYLSKFSRRLATTYFRTALWWCHCVGVAPSILLHPLDFLGREDEPDLGFFPAMDLPAQHKLHVVEDCLTALQERFQVVTMEQHARSLLGPRVDSPDLSALQV